MGEYPRVTVKREEILGEDRPTQREIDDVIRRLTARFEVDLVGIDINRRLSEEWAVEVFGEVRDA